MNTTPSFIHLRLHTEYSLTDSLVRIKPLMSELNSLEMPSVAITDTTNIFGLIKVYNAARSAAIKPIIGADVWVRLPEEEGAPCRLTLLCQDELGYKNLKLLLSKAYLEGQSSGKPIVEDDWLTSECLSGLIILSGGAFGEIGQAIASKNTARASTRIKIWAERAPRRFYLEVQRLGRVNEAYVNEVTVALAAEHQLPLVATNDVCFLKQEDFEAHEARVCISYGEILSDEKRARRYSPQQYLRSQEEMEALFSDLPEALQNTVEIAKRCNTLLTLGKPQLPCFPVPEGMSLAGYFEKKSQDALNERLKTILDAGQESTQRLPYDERLNYELGVINQMGFPGYFLIVADFIQWAKDQSIPVGPGRGSGAGSLVAYALGITDLDPIEHDLLFERFLNPERVSMPDFDIDFCMEKRDQVIEYVAERYGRDSVSQIITFGAMAAKAVIRDVGRVLGHPYGFVDQIAKLIPNDLGMTLTKALEQEEELKKRVDSEEEVQYLMTLAMKLEGLTRNVGKHAAGVVIAPSVVTDFSAIYCEPDNHQLVTHFDKDDVEAAGLVKFDFLGLRTLTIIDWAVAMINHKRKIHNESALEISRIKTDDAAAYDLLKSCATTAVFQLESRGMKDLIRRLQPDCFEDIVALVALYRPGPLGSGMVDDFINRKHGKAAIEYPHPCLENVLKPTYGVILYQEQVMQIAQVLASYTLGSADLLRRAMGKKKQEEMDKQRSIFVAGAEKNDVDPVLANSIFDLVDKFAGYGFNKSHSAAYALLSYQTAWLKAHYPAAFMASVLSSDMDNTDKVVAFIEEVRHLKLVLIPPHVNSSAYFFTIDASDRIIFGLGAIKGVGESAIESIIASRKAQGEYKDLFDFCCRVDLRRVNRRVLEALTRAGAFDGFASDRSTVFENLGSAIQYAEQCQMNQAQGMNDLFSVGAQFEVPALAAATVWGEQEKLRHEKTTLGFYLSGHPIDTYRRELKNMGVCPCADLSNRKDESVTVAGMLVALRKKRTKTGRRMAILTLDDHTTRVEVPVFSDVFEKFQHLLVLDQLIIIQGRSELDRYSGQFRLSVEQLFDFARARIHYARAIELGLDVTSWSAEEASAWVKQLPSHDEGLPVRIECLCQDLKVPLHCGAQVRIFPSDENMEKLEACSLSCRLVY